jgi:hypothetical protein
VITAHLNGTAPVSWCGLNFDFAGAEFSGGTVSFTGAEFSGGTVSFAGAGFPGGTVSFAGARFSGGRVSFAGGPPVSGKPGPPARCGNCFSSNLLERGSKTRRLQPARHAGPAARNGSP